MYSSWDMLRDGQTDGRTDGQTDGWKKWHIEVGAPPKKKVFLKDILSITVDSVIYHIKTWWLFFLILLLFMNI